MTRLISHSRHLDLVSASVLAVLALLNPALSVARTSAPEAPSSPPAEAAIESLELLKQFELNEERPHARDVRWASNDSVYIAFEGDGVTEQKLAEGLPVEKELIPKSVEGRGLQTVNLATSGSRLFASGHQYTWIDIDSSDADRGQIKSKLRGYFDDVDVRDDTVVLLGFPSLQHLTENEQTLLWLGDLRSDLAQWKPLSVLREDRGEYSSSPAAGSMGMRLGSVRFLANGEILAVPAFKPGVYQYSRTGKQRSHWSVPELESSLLSALGEETVAPASEPRALESKPPTQESAKSYLASQRIVVEDVIPARNNKGAAIVRYGSGKGARYYLAVLDGEPTWYLLPFRPTSMTDRIRADYSKSRQELVVLLTNRGGDQESPSRLFVLAAP